MVFGAEFFELCPHRRKPPLEDTDDLIADLGGREDGSVYQPTPTINLILGADDYFTSIAIHADEALGFLNLFASDPRWSWPGLHLQPQRSSLTPLKPKHTSSGMGLTRQKPSAALARSRVGRRTW
jgi:hypothetical protein